MFAKATLNSQAITARSAGLMMSNKRAFGSGLKATSNLMSSDTMGNRNGFAQQTMFMTVVVSSYAAYTYAKTHDQ